MESLYNAFLSFINAWFPNDLAIDLLKLNELFAYILVIICVFVFIKWLLKLLGVIRK